MAQWKQVENLEEGMEAYNKGDWIGQTYNCHIDVIPQLPTGNDPLMVVRLDI